MRNIDTVDAELSFLGAVRRSIQDQGGEPSMVFVDQLLDERREPTGEGRLDRREAPSCRRPVRASPP